MYVQKFLIYEQWEKNMQKRIILHSDALVSAISNHDTLEVTARLEEMPYKEGAQIYSFNQWHPPLHEAALNGTPKIIELMLDYGANINEQNKYGCTPLWLASRYSIIENVDTLLRRGADQSIRNYKDSTPLIGMLGGYADYFESTHPRNVVCNECRPRWGDEPCEKCFNNSMERDRVEAEIAWTMESLMLAGADWRAHNHYGETAINLLKNYYDATDLEDIFDRLVALCNRKEGGGELCIPLMY
jgi:hypothetical protein